MSYCKHCKKLFEEHTFSGECKGTAMMTVYEPAAGVELEDYEKLKAENEALKGLVREALTIAQVTVCLTKDAMNVFQERAKKALGE